MSEGRSLSAHLRIRAQISDVKDHEISVANYLLSRLQQLGVTAIFGVPGDFNLGFLDVIEDHPHIEWIGCCNELNAAYAADGYARIKENGIGVVVTTFGVGELSAMNGIAGAFSEMVPVLHIVGVPSTVQQKTKPMLHHTLGDGRYTAYEKAAEQFTICQAVLMDKDNAAAEIDRVLTKSIITARPAYLTLPTDIVYATISSGPLSFPLDRAQPKNDEQVEAFVVDQIVKLAEAANHEIVVLVDACTIRHDVKDEVKELLSKTGYPVYAAPMGKTAVSENGERYGGIYVGAISKPEIREKVESAKLILSVGALKSDFNTGNFTYRIPTVSTIELHSDHTTVQHALYQGIGMKQLLPKLTARLQAFRKNAQLLKVPRYQITVPKGEDGQAITHAWLWPRLGGFFREKDVVVAETGTASFGILDVPLPEGARFVSQILYGSIGWTVGSTLGAALAAKDLGLGRTILFIGDGSLQLTVQELSTMLRLKLNPIIFLLNNSGYTIERYLHGENRKYNDISNWNWTSLLNVFGDFNGTLSQSHKVRTQKELGALLDDEALARPKKIQFVEVIMDRMDAPHNLKMQAELSAKTNMYAQSTASAEKMKPIRMSWTL